MKVAKDTVVRFQYTLRDDEGEVLDESGDGEPLAYLHGHQQIVPGLEGALDGREAGDEFEVTVDPKQGYGEHDPEGVFEVPRDKLPPDVEPEVGLELASRMPTGQILRFRLTEINEDSVTADANHPLAGQNLNFAIKVVEVREPTDEERSHGHVHGEGGHHH